MNAAIQVFHSASQRLSAVKDHSVDLVVTSPPYPMIEMWDECFSQQSEAVRTAIQASDWSDAYREMHRVLNGVWDECDRVLKNNGFVCINIGDATRTCNGEFRLFSNHSAIISYFESKGYAVLPDIHWRKQTNAPNKFMGSGMLPAGAYVTYEHEYILIFRKGGKRVFKGEEAENRSRSAYFWEERNIWFSDLWDIKGTNQLVKNIASRGRSAAYPLEVPYRLINMYSAYGDTVLDPFGGIGTTAVACAIAGRNCVISEIDNELVKTIRDNVLDAKAIAAETVEKRVERHLQFIDELSEEKRAKCYRNAQHGFDVKTRQEIHLTLYRIQSIASHPDEPIKVVYEPFDHQSQISMLKSPLALTL